jgi:hypothetical protein
MVQNIAEMLPRRYLYPMVDMNSIKNLEQFSPLKDPHLKDKITQP